MLFEDVERRIGVSVRKFERETLLDGLEAVEDREREGEGAFVERVEERAALDKAVRSREGVLDDRVSSDLQQRVLVSLLEPLLGSGAEEGRAPACEALPQNAGRRRFQDRAGRATGRGLTRCSAVSGWVADFSAMPFTCSGVAEVAIAGRASAGWRRISGRTVGRRAAVTTECRASARCAGVSAGSRAGAHRVLTTHITCLALCEGPKGVCWTRGRANEVDRSRARCA